MMNGQWVQTNSGLSDTDVRAFAVSGANLFTGTFDGGVFLSTNNGTSWTQTSLDSVWVSAFAVSGTYLFAGTQNVQVFLSTNDGTSWTEADSGLTGGVWALATWRSNLFAGTYGGYGPGVFLSTNNGTIWTGGSGFIDVWTLAVSDTNLFAGTAWGSVFLTTNNGTSWTRVDSGLPQNLNLGVRSLAFAGPNLFAGTFSWVEGGEGIFLSTNNGTIWTPVNTGLTNTNILTLAVSGRNLFAGTAGGVFVSTNNGTSWTAINTGLMDTYVNALVVSDTHLFAGTSHGGIWRRPLPEMITYVEETSGQLPDRYALHQNYPNPFNPNTNIGYGIADFGLVRLVVYDLLGREVAVLVNENKAPGTYHMSFDGRNLASGVYCYRLNAGDFVAVRRMVLIR